MTDENRAELRRGIEAVVRASMVTGCYVRRRARGMVPNGAGAENNPLILSPGG